MYSSKQDAEKLIPVNVLDKDGPQMPQPNGPVVDKRPYKLSLKAGNIINVVATNTVPVHTNFAFAYLGKKYAWCLCGQSKSHPLCDRTHRIVQLKITLKYDTWCTVCS